MIIVLDASAAVRAVMDAESSFARVLEGEAGIIAPDLIVAEICSAFRKYVRARTMPSNHAALLIERAIGLVDETQPLRHLMADVVAMTSHIESSVYDLFYLALARETNATLITADQAFARVAAKEGIQVFDANSEL